MAEDGFDTFISYRRSDGSRIARRLRDCLLSYRLPEEFMDRERELSVYLDEIYEVATEDFFERTIKPALAASKRLVVIQTPGASEAREDGTENWVVREIQYYRSLPGDRPVWIALGKGKFDDPLPAALESHLPNVERVDVRSLDRPLGRLPEHELVKLIGPLLGVKPDKMPELRREEERKTRARRTRVLGGMTLLAAVLAALSTSALLGWSSARDRLQHQIALRLASESRSVPYGEQDTALLLAAGAFATMDVPEARQILLDQLNREPDLSRYVHCPDGEFANGLAIRERDGAAILGCESSAHRFSALSKIPQRAVLTNAPARYPVALDRANGFAFISGAPDMTTLTFVNEFDRMEPYETHHEASIVDLLVSTDGSMLQTVDSGNASEYWIVGTDGLSKLDSAPKYIEWQYRMDWDEQYRLANQNRRACTTTMAAERTDPLTIFDDESGVLAFATEENIVAVEYRSECHLLTGHVHNVNTLTLRNADNLLVGSAGQTGRQRYGGIIWKVDQPHPIARRLRPPTRTRWRTARVAISGDGRTVVGHQNHTVFVLNADDPTQYFEAPLEGTPRSIAISADGDRATVLLGESVYELALRNGPQEPEFVFSSERDSPFGYPRDVAFNSAEQIVVLGDKAAMVGDREVPLGEAFYQNRNCTGLSRDGKVAFGAGESILAENLESEQQWRILPQAAARSSVDRPCVYSFLTSRTLVRLISTYGSDPIEVTELGTGAPRYLQNPYRSQSGLSVSLDRAVVSANGQSLLVLSSDEADRILLYDLHSDAFNGALVAGEFYDVAVSDDGSVAVTVGSDGTLLWNLQAAEWAKTAREIAGRELTEDERQSFGLSDL